MRLRGLAVAAALAISVIVPVSSPQAAAEQVPPRGGERRAAEPVDKLVIYKGAALIDGTGAPLRSNMAIVVRGTKIESISSAADLPAQPSDAEVVDVSGLYATPGLIDSHVHLATLPNRAYAEAFLRRAVYGGVTAVRDMAGDARSLGEISRSAVAGEIPASDVYFAAAMSGAAFFDDPRTQVSARGWAPGTAPWMQAITEKTDIRLAVAQARGTGASGIKIYADLSAALVRNITAEAHRQGIMVWAHGSVFPAGPQDVVDAGVDVVSHIGFVSIALSPRMPQQFRDLGKVDFASILANYKDADPRLQGIFDAMRRKGEILDATVDSALNVEEALPGALDATARMTRQAYRSGVMISAGTDRRVAGDDPFPPLNVELELLAEKVGMPAADVIRSATLIGAKTFGREGEMGTLEPGKLANVAFMSKNPLEDIRNLRSVTLTVKRGMRYPRDEFQPISKQESAHR
jgi:imidazolonepropionase-like amidohydrolase